MGILIHARGRSLEERSEVSIWMLPQVYLRLAMLQMTKPKC